jgi:hypothetical protein
MPLSKVETDDEKLAKVIDILTEFQKSNNINN